MKKSIVAVLVVSLFICAGPCPAAEKQRPCPEKTDYQVPAEKMEQWDAMKGAAIKEHAVCVEHCGESKECLDKCKEVYKHRLDNQYQELLNQK